MGRTALGTAAALYVLSVAVTVRGLPAEVPLHFGLGGEADRYGSRTEALIGFAVLGLGMLAVWRICLWSVRRAGLDLVNVPHPQYWKTPEREPELRRRVEVDLTWFFAATVLLLAAIPVSTLTAARGSGELPWAFEALFVLYLLGTSAWCVFLVTRRYRPPAR
jgi:hypothetical protein